MQRGRTRSRAWLGLLGDRHPRAAVVLKASARWRAGRALASRRPRVIGFGLGHALCGEITLEQGNPVQHYQHTKRSTVLSSSWTKS